MTMKGQYVVYERASKEEESLFLDIAGEVVARVEEPASWNRAKDPRKRGGGRPYEYGFRPMLFVLLNVNLRTEEEVLARLKEVAGIREVHQVYGVYDIVTRGEAESIAGIKGILEGKVRRLDNVRSTLTMIVA
ncbi:MAG: Lrp/AsnC ligand binding domain-containing protein [Nitrososphaerota archaeon]|nr:Lrp/AsnC ligand binding domain-containing protein [Nitrososphaerota archaeon]MDG6945974.1 Lrp/AsnC ligand binding domain-containing protein [Nitrososphaerota archaeon]